MSRIALGIEEHGLAFAAWAAYVGTDTDELVDGFLDHYRGEYRDMRSYVHELLDQTGFYDDLATALQTITQGLRNYVDIDVDALVRDREIEGHIVETPGGGVWVFEL